LERGKETGFALKQLVRSDREAETQKRSRGIVFQKRVLMIKQVRDFPKTPPGDLTYS